MNVILLQEPKDLLRILYVAARCCYSSNTTEQLTCQPKTDEEMIKFISGIIQSGHHSVLEHASFTFGIDGVSRATTHQLVRHRLASYSQQSQRYVINNDPVFVTPPSIAKNSEALEIYTEAMKAEFDAYHKIKGLLGGPGIEDARYILGNGYSSNITFTVDLRELIHICNERLCTRAQWEIRHLFSVIRDIIILGHPWLNSYLVPKCKMLGFCPEVSDRGCGLMPGKE